MQSWLKLIAIIVGVFSGLSGCAPIQGSSREAQPRGIELAAQPDASQRKQTQLIVPNDKQTAAAINEALPTIKKVLAIHQCLKSWESLRMLNIYAVSGVNMAKVTDNRDSIPNSKKLGFPNGGFMEYHDLNKCVSVSTIDQWMMPALNVLQFRVIYFADDSGETVNFRFLFKKVDDGSWKIELLEHPYGY